MLRILGVIFLLGVLGFTGYGAAHPHEARASSGNEMEERSTNVLRKLHDSDFAFDSLTQGCFMWDRIEGGLTQVTCEVARHRLPFQNRQVLEKVEKDLGHPIP